MTPHRVIMQLQICTLDVATWVLMQPQLCMVDGVTWDGNAGTNMHARWRHTGGNAATDIYAR